MDVTTTKSTKVKTLAYNATVEVVLQNTVLVVRESHPMHLHGHNFFVLAQGFGNFHQDATEKQYNLVNPLERNTLASHHTNGWMVCHSLRCQQPRYIWLWLWMTVTQ
jgi:laccase